MHTWLSQKLTIANDIAERLSKVPGITAIVLGGSLARGRGSPNSDIDLGIYYHPDQKPSIPTLRQLAAEIDDARSGETVTDYGDWGPWINGGAWLTIDGQRLDWIYRDLDKVERIITQCEEGVVGRYAQPGHPHGFHTHIYLGEIHHSRILFDSSGVVSALKGRLTPYPKRLKEALISTYSWQIDFALHVSEKSVARAESSYVAGCFFESVYCMVQVLFALNQHYYMNEKGALKETADFNLLPQNFPKIVQEVLACPGRTSEELRESLSRLEALATEVHYLIDTQKD